MIRERRGAWSGVVRTGLPAEGGGASRGEGSGREVEARNDYGCSLWPTAKRFCSPIREQHQKLTQKLRGHYGYYGITGNYSSLQDFREESAKDLETSAVSATPRW